MAKALSLNEIRRRAAQFVVEWRDEPGDERQQAQSFIRDLLRVFGITSTKAALYEKRAKRSSTGHRGYIDALSDGVLQLDADAVRTLLSKELANGATAEELIEAVTVDGISENLYTSGQPDPDLVIRTSGETRISNFLLMQAAYAEFVFTPTL